MNTKLAIVLMFDAVIVVSAGLAFIWRERRLARNAGYVTNDEREAVQPLVTFQLGSLEKGDSKIIPLRQLQTKLSLGIWGMWSGVVLTSADAALIGPLIDRWLSGEIPHLLSSEYDDEIRQPLLKLKGRMERRR